MKVTENSKKNNKHGAHLKPYHFKKGQSGNPGGRPKGKSISKIMLEVLEELDPKTKQIVAEKAARAYIEQSLKNSSFANIVLDRTEGSVVQQVAVSELESLPQEMADAGKREIAAILKRKGKK